MSDVASEIPPKTFQVGRTLYGDIVINLPVLHPDENDTAHLVFSPGQATTFARILLKLAHEVEQARERRGIN